MQKISQKKASMKKFFLTALTIFFLLLPFHAFGVTMLNKIFFDPEFSAPTLLKAWKEIFLLILFIATDLFIISRWKKFIKSFDAIDSIILGFSAILIGISLFHWESLNQFIYGVKYDLFPLWIFLALKKIFELSEIENAKKFLHSLLKKIGYVGGGVVFIGFLFLLLPEKALVFLGYSADHSFHAFQRPLAFCQKLEFSEICRAQSTLSGPNQLATLLLFLLPLFLFLFHNTKQFFWLSLGFSGGVLLLFTFSRAAYIGGFIALVFFLWHMKNFPMRKFFLPLLLSVPVLLASALFFFAPHLADKIINRENSTKGHYEFSTEGIKTLVENPFGKGLGSAGAASKYSEEHAGNIQENWYLQIGIEGGFISIALFLILLYFVFSALKRNEESVFLASTFLGISISSLFLHSWESATVAYTVWGLAGIFLGTEKHSRQEKI